MIKLTNKNKDWYLWIGNRTSLEYKKTAMEVANKKKMCPAVKKIMAALAEQSLYTALKGGFSTLYSYDDENGYEKRVNTVLPTNYYDAISMIKEQYGF